MTIQDAKKWIAVINDNVLENKAYLGELDSLMGDGDQPDNDKGICGGQEYADQSEENRYRKIFIRVGMPFKSCPVYNGHLNRVSVYSGREGGGIINGMTENFARLPKAFATA